MPSRLLALPGRYVVAGYPPGTALTPRGGDLWSLTLTSDECSLVCAEPAPDGALHEQPGWRAWRVAGQLDFSLVGVLHALTGPLAAAGVSIFALSTYDTDYLLVPGDAAPTATAALRDAGHDVESH
ncbi:ACT domain-containing protein [Angustibacter aerolatus]